MKSLSIKTISRRLLGALTTGALALTVVLSLASTASAQSKTYYFKHFSTGGSQSTWYTNDNSWGYHETSGSGFVEMVMGDDWGTYSPYHPIPKTISQISTGARMWFWENHHVDSGGRIDSTWDNFVDRQPDSNTQGTEIMIWANWTNAQPICDRYNAQGQAVPTYYNVSLSGRTWNVYIKNYNNGKYTLSFLDTHQQGGENITCRPFLDFGTQHGYFSSSEMLDEVGAGWEYGRGWASATSYGNSGF